MKEWWSISDLVALAHRDLPKTKRGMSEFAAEGRWNEDMNRCREVAGNGGKRREYHYTLLPPLVQGEIVTSAMIDEVSQTKEETRQDLKAQSLWHTYHWAPETARNEADRRLKVVQEVDRLIPTLGIGGATELVSIREDIPGRTIARWRKLTSGMHKSDWLPALLPAHQGRTKTAKCDKRAWDMISSDYLRPEQPSFASCYTRMKEAAKEHGWSPVPARATLLRRIEKEFGKAAIIMARKGQHAAAALYPAQTRDRSVFHAMEAVNADGHNFDVFIRFEDGSIGRACMIAFQDLYSGMILCHRISQSENKETIRLAIADMVESWGIPEHVYFDNGRAFMSKWITGGIKHRFRFKVKDEEPKGVLTQLGVEVHNTTPYHGQAKPIERSFRDMCDRISRHPALAGAYTGNHIDAKPENYHNRAVPIEEFRKFVAGEIMRHNTHPDRNTQTVKGRSFAEAFEESLAKPGVVVRKATMLQRQFFLMAGEAKAARATNGEIHMAGNRYWSEHLIAHAGKKLMVRFDPENLHDDLFVYTLDGRFIDRAPCIEAVGFNDAEAARQHAKLKRQFMKANREVLRLGRLLTPAQVAAQIPDPDPVDLNLPKVVGLHHIETAANLPSFDAGEAFSRGLNDAMGVSSIFDHPNNKKEDG
ncbi:MAG: hypothetical protein CSA70_03525 [Rhodobacterales bacterium]|nr:MAG: hypothetical protein CSA70_03525 [Rhodobacterales bacterium]